MKKALVVGIDYYEHVSCLYGCSNDAKSVASILERNEDGTKNFDVKLCTAIDEQTKIKTSKLKDAVKELFADDSTIALFYFSGHGYIESTGGYIIGSDCKDGDDGFSLDALLKIINKSKAKNKIIVLDSCYSGIAGNIIADNAAIIAEGVTILTASTKEQYAMEKDGVGVFTHLFVDALNGVAANLLGEISPGSIYSHIDQSLGAWEQRPVFKTNVKNFISLRKVEPAIKLSDLQRLIEFFPTPDYEFRLDPSYEPEEKGKDEGMPKAEPEHTKVFSVLQKLNRLNLVVPVDVPHMWNAAIESKACKLTVLGKHYRRLVEKGRI